MEKVSFRFLSLRQFLIAFSHRSRGNRLGVERSSLVTKSPPTVAGGLFIVAAGRLVFVVFAAFREILNLIDQLARAVTQTIL